MYPSLQGRFILLLMVSISSYTINGQSITNPPPSLGCSSTLFEETFSSGTAPTGWSAGNKGFGTNADIDEGWYFDTDQTPTPNTGPNSGSTGDGYAYYEVSGIEKPDSKDTLISPTILLTGTGAHLTFDLLLYGLDVQSLQIDIVNQNSTRTTIASYTGAQNNHDNPADWETAYIDLSSFIGQEIKIEFIGTKNGSPQSDGDIAIDNINICSENAAPIPSLSTWAMIILLLMLSIVGLLNIYKIPENQYV